MMKTLPEAIKWCKDHLNHHLQHMAVDHEPRTMIQVDPAELIQVLAVLNEHQLFSRGDTNENNPTR